MTYTAVYLVGHDYMQKWAPYNNHLANVYAENCEAENSFMFVIEAFYIFKKRMTNSR